MIFSSNIPGTMEKFNPYIAARLLGKFEVPQLLNGQMTDQTQFWKEQLTM